ncbi:MAG: response regulator [Gemmatimonadetes bacterium]|nr:response regulator [Gemmatimonadota bacterium]
MAITVLVVEDEEKVRGLLRRRLEAAGYAVIESSTAEDAILRYQASPPDVVVTDIVLPGRSGLDLIAELEGKFPGARIVAMSGALDSDVAGLLRRSKEMGAVYGLPKPFTTGQMLDAVQAALAGPTAGAPRPVAPAAPAVREEDKGRTVRLALLAVLLALLGLMFAMGVIGR